MSELKDQLIPLATRNVVEYDEVWVDIGKRVFAQLDIIVVFLNCISACFSISAGVSMIPYTTAPDPGFCDMGAAMGIYVECPYLESPAFFGILGVCVLYFASFLAFKIFWTFEFASNDLRFYISCDMVVNSIVHKCFVVFGIFFTIAGGLTGISYVIENGSTDSLGLIFTFMGVNFYTFANMFNGRYRVLRDSEVTVLFPDPIYIRSPEATMSNLHGILINHRDLFDALMKAFVSGSVEDNDKYLSNYGSPAQLKHVLRSLSIAAVHKR